MFSTDHFLELHKLLNLPAGRRRHGCRPGDQGRSQRVSPADNSHDRARPGFRYADALPFDRFEPIIGNQFGVQQLR